MSKQYKMVPAKLLPEGWMWQMYNDGSGSLISPEGTSHYIYDKVSYREYGLADGYCIIGW